MKCNALFVVPAIFAYAYLILALFGLAGRIRVALFDWIRARTHRHEEEILARELLAKQYRRAMPAKVTLDFSTMTPEDLQKAFGA